MRHHNHLTIPYFSFAAYDEQPGLVHAVFTREGGVSPSPWDSLNLGWAVGDDDANVEQNYERWASALGIKRNDLTTTHQVHGNRVLVADRNHKGGSLGKADALITVTPEVPLVQRYADCTPVMLYDPVKHACGIAHAGWRGTVARCAEAAVLAMQAEFDSRPADLIGAVGPAIGSCCYEVGEEVISAVRTTQRHPDNLLFPGPNGHGTHFDLWAANAQQLKDAGVVNIEVAELCTACHRDTFFSHRGDKGQSGRFAAFIMLKRRV